MSKRTRTLLIGGIVVAVLAVLLAVLLLLPPADDGDEPDTDETGDDTSTAVTLVDKYVEDKNATQITLSSATVTAGKNSYTIKANKDGDLLVEGWEDLPHDSTAADELWDALQTVVADRLITETPEDPATFGFDGDAIKVEAVYSDNTTFALEIGGEAPSGEGLYIRVPDKAPIYLIDSYSLEPFFEQATHYLSKSPITVPEVKSGTENSSDQVVIRDAELSGSVRPKPLFFQTTNALMTDTGISVSPSGYIIKKPYYRAVSTNSALIQYASFSGFTASDIAKVYPTAADLNAYGLNTPYSACTFNLAVQHPENETDKDGEEVTTYSYYHVFKYTVKLGNKNDDGLRYAVVYAENELLPLVYLVDESAVAWAATQYDDIADTLLFYIHIVAVDKLTVTADGVATPFKLTHIEVEGETNPDLEVKANGKTYDSDLFRDMYAGLMGIYRTGAAESKPTGTPTYTVKLETNTDAVPDLEIKLYRTTASKYTVVHSTGEMYTVDAKKLEAFMTQYRLYLKGEAAEF